MSDACTVVIGVKRHLDALRERARGDGKVLAFNDTQTLRALEAIAEHRPEVVTLERLFAATPRGAALIQRIKADPALSASEIRVISHDGEYFRVSPRRAVPQAPAANSAPETPAEAVANLDWRGTRRAPRFRMVAGTEAQLDGGAAALLDLSTLGAMVVSLPPLKPHQRVRMTLTDDSGAARFSAAVVWASLEIPKGVTNYRAGLEFKDAKPTAVEAFIERHKG